MVASNSVFFAVNAGSWTLQSVALTGGPAATLASNLPPPGGVAVDGSNVFWNDASGPEVSSVQGLSLAGGTPTTMHPPSDPGFADEHTAGLLLVDADAFYSVESWSDPQLTVVVRRLSR